MPIELIKISFLKMKKLKGHKKLIKAKDKESLE
jgi:hypothetical protein